jgi:hypothetical protein
MCGVCVSIQGGSVAPSLYVAGVAAVGAAGWQRLRAGLPSRRELEASGVDDANDVLSDDVTAATVTAAAAGHHGRSESVVGRPGASA